MSSDFPQLGEGIYLAAGQHGFRRLPSMESHSPHPFAQRRAELVAALHQVGQPLLGDPGLTPEQKANVIAAYEQALRRVFALDEEAGVE